MWLFEISSKLFGRHQRLYYSIVDSSNGRLFQTYMQHLDVFVMGDDVEVIDRDD